MKFKILICFVGVISGSVISCKKREFNNSNTSSLVSQSSNFIVRYHTKTKGASDWVIRSVCQPNAESVFDDSTCSYMRWGVKLENFKSHFETESRNKFQVLVGSENETSHNLSGSSFRVKEIRKLEDKIADINESLAVPNVNSTLKSQLIKEKNKLMSAYNRLKFLERLESFPRNGNFTALADEVSDLIKNQGMQAFFNDKDLSFESVTTSDVLDRAFFKSAAQEGPWQNIWNSIEQNRLLPNAQGKFQEHYPRVDILCPRKVSSIQMSDLEKKYLQNCLIVQWYSPSKKEYLLFDLSSNPFNEFRYRVGLYSQYIHFNQGFVLRTKPKTFEFSAAGNRLNCGLLDVDIVEPVGTAPNSGHRIVSRAFFYSYLIHNNTTFIPELSKPAVFMDGFAAPESFMADIFGANLLELQSLCKEENKVWHKWKYLANEAHLDKNSFIPIYSEKGTIPFLEFEQQD